MSELIQRAISGQEPTSGYDYPVGGKLGFSATIPGGLGSTVSGYVQIDATFDFLWLDTTGAWTAPDFSVEFEYPDGMRQQQGTCYGPLALGQAPFAEVVEPGYLCRNGQRINYRLTNRAAPAITVDVVLGGVFFRRRAS